MCFCRRKFGQTQLTSSYLNVLIDSRKRDFICFAAGPAPIQNMFNFIWDESVLSIQLEFLYLCHYLFFPPRHIKEVVIMRWMSSDTMKLKREKLIQNRSLIFIKWASCRLSNIIRKLGRGNPVKYPSESVQIIFNLGTGLRNTWLHYPFLLFNTSVSRYVNICRLFRKYITDNVHCKEGFGLKDAHKNEKKKILSKSSNRNRQRYMFDTTQRSEYGLMIFWHFMSCLEFLIYLRQKGGFTKWQANDNFKKF